MSNPSLCCDSKPFPGGRAAFLGALLAGLSLFGLAGCAHSPASPEIPGATTPDPVPAAAASTATARPTVDDLLHTAAAVACRPFEGEGWRDLFNGQSLEGWHEVNFAGGGEIECKSGLLLLPMGDPFTGVSFTNEVPRINYEVALDALRVMGSDFFCGLTVPVGESFCSLIVGGWGGGLVGISSLDSLDASENETMKFMKFDQGRWYRIRLRVTEHKIEAWIDDDKIIDVVTTGKRISLRPGEIELAKPFGICTWQTSGAFREIKLRPVGGPASGD